jgi:hypothetical protein
MKTKSEKGEINYDAVCNIYDDYIKHLTPEKIIELEKTIVECENKNKILTKEDNILEPTLIGVLLCFIVLLVIGLYFTAGLLFVFGIIGLFRLKHVEDSIWVNNLIIRGIISDIKEYELYKIDPTRVSEFH